MHVQPGYSDVSVHNIANFEYLPQIVNIIQHKNSRSWRLSKLTPPNSEHLTAVSYLSKEILEMKTAS